MSADLAASRPATPRPVSGTGAAARWLERAVTAWLAVALLGQGLFAAYVAGYYGGAAARGEPQRLNRVMPHAWTEGQAFDNGVLWAHLLFAVVLVAAGAFQLWPRLRQRWPAVHRWNGRAFVVSATVLATGGLWLVWVRGGVAGDLSQHLAISVNAALTLGCAAMAVRAARRRQFDRHRVWALRLLAAASGVWLFRIGLMAWLGLWRSPVGFDPASFSGPFLTALAWAMYALLPLPILEAVLRARRGVSPAPKVAAAVGLGALTLLAAFGIAMAVAGMWAPKLMRP
jgi:Predicted membrane protein (DUF2306)